MPPQTANRLTTAVFFLLLALYVGWMLSLPAWPSQDGPVHLYYTHVLGTLFTNASSPYKPFLYIKHLLPPYAVYYYTLLALSHFVSLLTADRLVICGYMISFALGFRFVARAMGPGFRWTSLLACILLLNWALGMGFANYCLSLSFALWAIGLWLRFNDAPQWGRRAAFLALLVVITLSHPVPLLIVLAFAGLDILCRLLFPSAGETRDSVFRRSRPNLYTLACGALCLLYVKAFTVAHPLEQRTALHGSALQQIARRALQIATAKSLGLLYGHWTEVLVYRGALLLLLLVPAILAFLQFRRNRRSRQPWTAADTCVVFLILLGISLPLLPSDISGAYFFSERLTLLLWILALLAASAWQPQSSPAGVSMPTRADLVAVIFALCLTGLLLHLAETSLRPLAKRQRRIAETSLPTLTGRHALVLPSGAVSPIFERLAPAWNPFQWDTVALLQRNNGILENAPWLDSPIIPLAPTPALEGAWLPRLLANSPFELASALPKSAPLQHTFLSGSDVLLFSPILTAVSPSTMQSLGPSWTCTAPPPSDFQVCTRP